MSKNIHIISPLPDGEGHRIVNDFLEEVTNNLVKYSKKSFEIEGDYALNYNEATVSANVAAAIIELTSLCYSEYSVKRNNKERGKVDSGKVDFLTAYRNYNILLELKRTRFTLKKNTKKGKFRQNEKDRWKELVKQVNSLRGKENCENLPEDNSVFIGLDVVLSYLKTKEEYACKQLFSEYEKTFAETLKTKPRKSKKNAQLWAAYWKLPEAMVCSEYEDEKDNKYREYTPFIGFRAYVVVPSKKRETT